MSSEYLIRAQNSVLQPTSLANTFITPMVNGNLMTPIANGDQKLHLPKLPEENEEFSFRSASKKSSPSPTEHIEMARSAGHIVTSPEIGQGLNMKKKPKNSSMPLLTPTFNTLFRVSSEGSRFKLDNNHTSSSCLGSNLKHETIKKVSDRQK